MSEDFLWEYPITVTEVNHSQLFHFVLQYINGKLAMSHEIGHLPFVANVSPFLNFDDENDIVVLVNNTLTVSTVPQGSSVLLPR